MEDTLLEGDEAFDAMITGTDKSAVVFLCMFIVIIYIKPGIVCTQELVTFLWVHLSPFLAEQRFRLNCVHSGAGDFSGSHCVTVSGMEDTLLEGDEAFDAMITGTDQSAVVSVGASDTATVTITDNDGAYDIDRSRIVLTVLFFMQLLMCDKRDAYICTYLILYCS